MPEEIKLMILTCPQCGDSLKAENLTTPIQCLSCNQTVIPITESRGQHFPSLPGTFRIEGIKTPSSALAYIELFFDDYDWESFTYSQELSIESIDTLITSLKNSSADDKNTWFVCFQSTFVPYLKKVEGCSRILQSVISAYEGDSLDAYSHFDAYKRITAVILNSREKTLDSLQKFISYAAKYGATQSELDSLKADVTVLRELPIPTQYDSIEQIPEIRDIIQQQNDQVLEDLARSGINAQVSYSRAMELIRSRQYVPALNILLSLRTYADSRKLATQLDRFYSIFNVLEICGKLYYLSKPSEGSADTEGMVLHPTENGTICPKPLIKHIDSVITNHADVLYYRHTNQTLRSYCFTTGEKKTLFSENIQGDSYYYNRKIYFLSNANQQEIVSLSIATGAVDYLGARATRIVSLEKGMLVHTTMPDGELPHEITVIRNLDTGGVTILDESNLTIHGYINGSVVYTVENPNAANKDLYIQPLGTSGSPRLLEANILSFCNILSDKLFFYVGCTGNRSMISMDPDGTGRYAMPPFLDKLLFSQGEWIYYIRRARYNTALCRSKIDGSEYRVIAPGIEQYIALKNGYLYYLDDENTLVKVRMDGSNRQVLCHHVEKVLSVKEERIVFLSLDDGNIKSIYAVDFDGSGIRKLVYHVLRAKEYDEDTVYFVTPQEEPEIPMDATEAPERYESLYRLNVNTGLIEKLLDIKIEQNSGCLPGLGLWIIAAIGLLLFIIDTASGGSGVGIIGLIICLVFFFLGVLNSKDP